MIRLILLLVCAGSLSGCASGSSFYDANLKMRVEERGNGCYTYGKGKYAFDAFDGSGGPCLFDSDEQAEQYHQEHKNDPCPWTLSYSPERRDFPRSAIESWNQSKSRGGKASVGSGNLVSLDAKRNFPDNTDPARFVWTQQFASEVREFERHLKYAARDAAATQ